MLVSPRHVTNYGMGRGEEGHRQLWPRLVQNNAECVKLLLRVQTSESKWLNPFVTWGKKSAKTNDEYMQQRRIGLLGEGMIPRKFPDNNPRSCMHRCSLVDTAAAAVWWQQWGWLMVASNEAADTWDRVALAKSPRWWVFCNCSNNTVVLLCTLG